MLLYFELIILGRKICLSSLLNVYVLLCQVLIFIPLLSFPNMPMKVTGDSFSLKNMKVSVVCSSGVFTCILGTSSDVSGCKLLGSWSRFWHFWPLLTLHANVFIAVLIFGFRKSISFTFAYALMVIFLLLFNSCLYCYSNSNC